MATQPDEFGLADNPLVKAEIQMASLAPYRLFLSAAIPTPPDLVSDYWGAVRQLVKTHLSS